MRKSNRIESKLLSQRASTIVLASAVTSSRPPCWMGDGGGDRCAEPWCDSSAYRFARPEIRRLWWFWRWHPIRLRSSRVSLSRVISATATERPS